MSSQTPRPGGHFAGVSKHRHKAPAIDATQQAGSSTFNDSDLAGSAADGATIDTRGLGANGWRDLRPIRCALG